MRPGPAVCGPLFAARLKTHDGEGLGPGCGLAFRGAAQALSLMRFPVHSRSEEERNMSEDEKVGAHGADAGTGGAQDAGGPAFAGGARGADAAAESARETDAAAGGAQDAGRTRAKGPLSVSRRSLLIGAGGTAALLGLGALRYAGHNPLVRPPGGQDESHLVSACIRCEKCYEACPRGVIVPAHVEDGLLGMRSPALSFDDGWCDFCAQENGGVPLCVATCPTEALTLPEGAVAQSTVLGLAVIDEAQCLAFRDTGCRYCYDACVEAGFDAIELSTEGANPQPHVIEDKCVGCGACESVCVSLKAGSIASGATKRAVVVRPLETLE